eukprot:3414348-Prymnesium_polylepis.1
MAPVRQVRASSRNHSNQGVQPLSPVLLLTPRAAPPVVRGRRSVCGRRANAIAPRGAAAGRHAGRSSPDGPAGGAHAGATGPAHRKGRPGHLRVRARDGCVPFV